MITKYTMHDTVTVPRYNTYYMLTGVLLSGMCKPAGITILLNFIDIFFCKYMII